MADLDSERVCLAVVLEHLRRHDRYQAPGEHIQGAREEFLQFSIETSDHDGIGDWLDPVDEGERRVWLLLTAYSSALADVCDQGLAPDPESHLQAD